MIKYHQRLGGMAAILWLRSARGKLREAALKDWAAGCEPEFFANASEQRLGTLNKVARIKSSVSIGSARYGHWRGPICINSQKARVLKSAAHNAAATVAEYCSADYTRRLHKTIIDL